MEPRILDRVAVRTPGSDVTLTTSISSNEPGTTCAPKLRRLKTRVHRSEEGSALVEFALVVPLMLTLVVGMFTFGIGLNTYLQLTDAVGIGGRAIAISRGSTTDPCATAAQAVYTAMPGLAQGSFTFAFTFGTPGNTASYSGPSCSSPSTTTGAAGYLTPGANATMSVTYPVNLSVLGMNGTSTGQLLQSNITELVQ